MSNIVDNLNKFFKIHYEEVGKRVDIFTIKNREGIFIRSVYETLFHAIYKTLEDLGFYTKSYSERFGIHAKNLGIPDSFDFNSDSFKKEFEKNFIFENNFLRKSLIEYVKTKYMKDIHLQIMILEKIFKREQSNLILEYLYGKDCLNIFNQFETIDYPNALKQYDELFSLVISFNLF